MKQKNMSTSLFTKIFLIISIPILIFFITVVIFRSSTYKPYSYNPIVFYYQITDDKPMIEDSNVVSIKIDQKVTVENLEYHFSSLDIGDNYSVINYKPITGTDQTPFGGAKLYQDNILLPYISASSSSFDGNAIGYAPAQDYGNLELRIDTIAEKTKSYYAYPIAYSGDSTNVEVSIEGINGVVTIAHDKESYIITSVGLESLEVKKEFGNRQPVVYSLYSGDEKINEYSENVAPDTLKITIVDVIYEGETIIIPIS